MKSLIRNLLAVLCLASSMGLSAQQLTTRTFFRDGILFFNPAEARYQENLKALVNYRSEWSGIEGAPSTSSFLVQGPITDRVGLGLTVVADRTLFERNTTFTIPFSYEVQLTRFTYLYLGVQAGGSLYSIDTDALDANGVGADPLLSNETKFFVPNFGLGAMFKGQDYFIGLSVPGILQSNRFQNLEATQFSAYEETVAYGVFGCSIYLNQSLELQPTVVSRYSSGTPLSVEVNSALEVNESFKFGASHRFQEASSLFAQIRLGNSIWVGYAYEFGHRAGIRTLGDSTHEIVSV